MKRVSFVFVAVVLVFHSFAPLFSLAAADVISPVFESISVDRKTVKEGETVRVSVKASDDVEVSHATVSYKTPITGKTMFLILYYNSETGSYIRDISADSSFEQGLYKIEVVSVEDTSENRTVLFADQDSEKKLEAGEFEYVGESEADTSLPVFESISVDKEKVRNDDTVKVSVKAHDNVAIKNVYITYYHPITKKELFVQLNYNNATGFYENSINVNSSFETGIYKVRELTIEDTSRNFTRLGGLEAGKFEYIGESEADITYPVFESIQANQKQVTAGDKVNISLQASDNIGISNVEVSFKHPITVKWMKVTLDYNSTLQTFEKEIPINTSFEPGEYTISSILIEDTSGNITNIYDDYDTEKKLVAGHFRYISEFNPPQFHSLTISDKESELGKNTSILVHATDDTKVKDATIHYESPLTQTKKSIELNYNEETKQLQGEFIPEKETEVGLWKVHSLEVTDINLNTLLLNADDLDLSAGDVTVLPHIEPLGAHFVIKNETWKNKTIDGDVYISPGAILKIDGNVKINGDLYVVGGLRSYTGLTVTGSLHAQLLTYGRFDPFEDGQAILSGMNSISRTIISTRMFQEIPFVVHNTPLISTNRKIDLNGATLPFVNVTINDTPVVLNSNGTFRVSEYQVDKEEVLLMKITDSQGFEYTKTIETYELFLESITSQTTSIQGRTQANMKIVLSENGKILAETHSDEKGIFLMEVENLVEKSTLNFEVFDADNNQITAKSVLVLDTTAPTAPKVEEVSDISESIQGVAEKNTTVFVRKKGKEIGSGKAGENGEFSIPIKKLVAEETIRIFAVDEAGNKSDETIIKVSDKTAPEWPAAATLEVIKLTETSLTVTWPSATDTSGIASYKCYLNGEERASTLETSCSIMDLKPLTDYVMRIEAIDKHGNVSASGPSLTVKTKGSSRISGPTRYHTAVEFSKAGFAKADTVILARGDNFPDALAGAPLAYKLNAPILLTKQNTLSAVTQEEIKRLGASEVIILGGPSAVSEEVAEQVKAMGVGVDRIFGKGRTDTANQIAKRVGKSDKVILAYGYNFPDALAIAPYAAQKGYPILLTDKSEVSDATRRLIKEYGKDQVIVVGGEGVITKNMVNSLDMKNIKRIAGKNRFETAATIISDLGLKTNRIYIANGHGFADALTGSVLAAKNGAPMLLVKADNIPGATMQMIEKNPNTHFTILGGEAVVNREVADSLLK